MEPLMIGEIRALKRLVMWYLGGPTRTHITADGVVQQVIASDHQKIIHSGEDATYLVSAFGKMEKF